MKYEQQSRLQERTADILKIVATSVNKAMEEEYGPPTDENRLQSHIAVALMQLSMRYFVETKASKAVILQFVHEALGATPEDMPPKPLPLSIVKNDG